MDKKQRRRALKLMDAAESIQDRVYWFIVSRGSKGATSDEVETYLFLRHQTASARLNEIRKMGKVIECGCRLTRSGRKAKAYAARGGLNEE